MRDKIVTFRMEQDDFLAMRRELGLMQFQTGKYMSVSSLLNLLIADFIADKSDAGGQGEPASDNRE